MATIIIALLEVAIVFSQLIYFLERPDDKNRLWYLLLLCLLIGYNACNLLLPDKNLPIPLTIQTIFIYFMGAGLSMYLVFYLYNAFQLRHLKLFALYGTLLFILCPFILVFAIPYSLTNDLSFCKKMVVIIPFLYSIAFVYSVTRALILKYKRGKSRGNAYEEVINVAVAFLFFASLPFIAYFEDYEALGYSLTNIGFFVMTLTYVRSSIIKSKREYKQLQESEQRLQQMNEKLKDMVLERTNELEELNAKRTETFIKLAHETKTPLTLINNYLSDYIDKVGDSCELRIIKASIQKINCHIINYFDIERSNEDLDVHHENTVVDVSDLLSSALVLFRSLANKKSIYIGEEIAPDVIVNAPANDIERIINNLLENAIKYTPNGGSMRVRLSTSETQVLLTFSDTGIGIPEAMHQQVFQPYVQLDRNNSDGMGMGLSIVKKIVEDLRGDILLKSAENAGTEITIVLPKATEKELWIDSNQSIQEDKTIPEASIASVDNAVKDEINYPNRPYILIVEDNRAMLSYLALKLSAHYNIYTAINGLDALERLKDIKSLDLIISDVMMDIMDGFNFYKEVAALKVYDHIPFIFLTAKITSHDKLHGLQLGAIDYIGKPFFLLSELHQKIESILAKFKKQRQALLDSAYQNIIPNASDKNIVQEAKNPDAFEANCKIYGLTGREIEICSLVMKGLQHRQVALELHIAETTVAKHMSNVFSKMDVSNRVELINKLDGNQISV